MNIQDKIDIPRPAKITPPEAGCFFSRPDLERKLAGLIDKPGKIWLSSPGGAGKTSLVRNLLVDDPRPLIWYQVDSNDYDIANFLRYVTQAAGETKEREACLPSFSPEQLADPSAFFHNFCRTLFYRYQQGCVLVFDDLQEGSAELFIPFLEAAMHELPDHSSLFVLSREIPYVQFARNRLNGSMFHLDWNDLRLSKQETRDFLTWRHGKEASSQTLDRAFELTQGWLAGLLLFSEDSGEGELIPRISCGQTDLLFDYFAGEIFSRLPEETRDFLLACGFLTTIEVSLAERLTGKADTGDILRGLVRENYFTFRISSVPEVYRFHPLFRQFLLSRAEQLDLQRLTLMRERAARLLIEVGQIEAAADLLIQIQAWPLLKEQIDVRAEVLLSQGRSQTLLQWLKVLPAELRDADAWHSYWFGCCLMARNPAEALMRFATAYSLFEAGNDDLGCMLAWSRVVDAIIVGWDDYGELDRWIEHFDLLRQRHPEFPSPEIEALMVQGILKSLVWRQPSHPDLPAWAARLYHLVTTSSDSNFRILAGSNLTFYHIVAGELVTAKSLVEVLNSDLYAAEVPPLKKLIWLATRSTLECFLYDRDGCLASVASGREIIEESGVHLLDLRLYGQGVTLGLSSGDLELPRRLLEELPTTPILSALDHSFSSHLLANYCLLQGDTAKAITLAELAVKRADDGGSPLIKSYCLAGLTLTLYQDGQIERAESTLEEGFTYSRGMNYFTCHFQLFAAFFALLRKDTDRAEQLLRQGFGLAARQGYLNFHPWSDEIMTRICGEALAADIEVDYVKRLALLHQLDLSLPSLPNLTPKEIETLTWIREGKTSWEVSRILGVSEATVKYHVGNILRKLNASSRSQAVAIALEIGLLKK